MFLFNVPIDEFRSKQEIEGRLLAYLKEESFHRIATVNPEFLLLAKHDSGFRDVLLAADMRVTDGFGVVLTGWFKRKYVERYPGIDLMGEILTIAERDGHSVFLAVKKTGLSSYEEISVALLKIYPNLKVNGMDMDPHATQDSSILDPDSNVILCNFGAPEQEIFLENFRGKNSSVRLAMGVGGSFDFLTDKLKRAPKWMRAIGLEWLWRLILQPKRFKRIWNATIVFLFAMVFTKENREH